MPNENGQSPKELYIADLRSQIARLEALLAAVETEGENLGGAVPSGGATTPRGATIRPDTFFGLSTPQATKKFLEMMGTAQRPTAIADALVQGGLASTAERGAVLNNVYTAFRRGGDEFVQVGRLWGLASWYPQKPKPETAPSKKKSRKSSKRKARPKTAIAEAPTPSQHVPEGWRAFLSKRLAAGKTMKEASAEWKSQTARAD